MGKGFEQIHYKIEYPNGQSTYEKVLAKRANFQRTSEYQVLARTRDNQH